MYQYAIITLYNFGFNFGIENLTFTDWANGIYLILTSPLKVLILEIMDSIMHVIYLEIIYQTEIQKRESDSMTFGSVIHLDVFIIFHVTFFLFQDFNDTDHF